MAGSNFPDPSTGRSHDHDRPQRTYHHERLRSLGFARETLGDNFGKLLGSALGMNQFAILSVPQMSVTLRALNEDADAEFLANPRVVTADNSRQRSRSSAISLCRS